MNTFAVSLEIMKLAIVNKPLMNNNPAETVQDSLRDFQRIHKKVLELDELLKETGCQDCQEGDTSWPNCINNCRKKVTQLFKIIQQNEITNNLSASEKVDKVLEYYEELFKQSLNKF